MATRPIDEKIVVMRLDNSDFKQKAIETTGLFGKLRDGLNKIPGVNLGKTTQELGDIGKQTKGINMEGLNSSLQAVTSRFTNLGIIGVTALTNITNKAVDAGMSLAKSLTLDQVTAGFGEYELKMGSIQTILANTAKHGTNLDDVSNSLEELNKYADQTIYNFGDMTKNIGLFTNAGLKLEESTSMIKGFSNAAAASGTSAEGASNAAYQLSQALSAGTIRLMDWRSLTNVGMGNKNMQEGLVDLATAMGAFKGSGIDGTVALKDFNGSLEKNWLSADVMSKYLQIMAKDMDATEMAALGLTDAQIKMFEQQSTTAEEAATKVRTFSGLMDGLKEAIGSGWAVTFEHMFGNFDEATVLWSRLSEAVNGFFEGQGAKRNALFEGIADKGGFKNIFAGIESAVKPVMQVFGSVTAAFKRVFPPASVDQIVRLTESFKAFTAGLTMNDAASRRLTNIFQGVFSIFSTVWEITKRLASAFVQLIPEGTGNGALDLLEKLAKMAIGFNESVKAGNGLTSFIDGLGNVLGSVGNGIKDAIGSFVDFSSSVKDNVGKAVDWLVEKLSPVGKFLKDTFGGFGGDDLLGAGGLVGIVLIVKKITSVFDDLTGFLGDAGGIVDSIKDVFGGVGDAVNNFATGIKIVNLVLIATALGILAVALKTLEGISTEDMAKGITTLATSLGVMLGGMALMSKFNITGGLGASVTLIALATAVSIMASALKKISDLNPKELATGLGGVVTITVALAGAVIAMGALGGKIKTSSLQLIALAGAIYILASAVKVMADIDPGSLFTAIGAMALIFAQLAIFLKVVDKSKLSISSAVGLIAVAGAVHLMVSAIQKISDIDTNVLVKGLTTITVILAQIAIFSKLAGGPNLMAAGVGLLLVAGAINALMGPITTLGAMTWEELVKGLGGMAIALAAVAGAALLMSGSMAGALGLVVMAAGLNLLIGPIERFAAMTWTEMLKGFVGLAGGMLLLAGAALLLTPAVPSMLAFGAGLALMGAAILAIGAGMALFGIGLSTLATLTAVSITAIVSAFALLITGLATVIPATVDFIVKLGLALIDGLLKLVPPAAEALATLIVKLLETISKHLPRFLELGVDIVVKLIDGIADALPKLVESGLNLIISFINTLSDAISQNGPLIISAVLKLLGEIVLLFVEAGVQVINSLFGWIPGVKDITANIGKTAEKTIRDNFGATETGKDKGKEFATALGGTSKDSSTAGKTIAEAGKKSAGSIDMKSTGSNFGAGFASGISSKLKSVVSSAESLAKGAYNKIKSWLDIRSPSKKTDKLGQNTGDGFAKGIAKKKKAAEAAAKKTATAAQKTFGEKMADAKYKFDMEEISATQYIAELNKIKKAYAKIPANNRKVDLEIKKVREKADKEKADAFKAQMDKEKKAIADRKHYNNLSLMQELDAWQKVLNKYKKGTEERSEADKEVFRIKNEINSKLLSLNEEYVAKVSDANKALIEGEKQLRQEYEDSVKSKADSLAGFTGLFDKVDEMVTASGQELIDNLKGQNRLFDEWSTNIFALGTKGIDKGLLTELREMGPKSAAEIKAINSMTDVQLKEYVSLWKNKQAMARNEAVRELDGLKKETETKIKELHAQTAKQLAEYKNEWVKSVNEITKWTKDGFVGLNASMSSIGGDAIKGLMKGISNMEGPLKTQAKALADSVSATIRKALQIKSPSRVLERDGEHGGQGFANGLANKAKDVASSSKNLASTARDSLNEFLEGFELDKGDDELHFKAIIDYDSIDSRKLGGIGYAVVQPDTSFATNGISATKATISQNGNNTRRDMSNSSGTSNQPQDNTPKQPVIIQIPLNGRVIAEETYEDVSQLMGNRTNVNYAMRGV